MSHLGELLSALVDGELGGAERDEATAHLARCEQCRAEAAGLRDLKRQLRALAEQSPAVAAAEADVVRRLMTMSGIGSTQPERRRLRALAGPGLPGLPGLARPPARMRPPGPSGPGGPGGKSRPQGARALRRHRRYLVLGTVSIVVGLGTAAFTAGGGDPAPGPKITPQMELYSEEHAITTGEVPLNGIPGEVEPISGSAVVPGIPASEVLPTVPAPARKP